MRNIHLDEVIKKAKEARHALNKFISKEPLSMTAIIEASGEITRLERRIEKIAKLEGITLHKDKINKILS